VAEATRSAATVGCRQAAAMGTEGIAVKRKHARAPLQSGPLPATTARRYPRSSGVFLPLSLAGGCTPAAGTLLCGCGGGTVSAGSGLAGRVRGRRWKAREGCALVIGWRAPIGGDVNVRARTSQCKGLRGACCLVCQRLVSHRSQQCTQQQGATTQRHKDALKSSWMSAGALY